MNSTRLPALPAPSRFAITLAIVSGLALALAGCSTDPTPSSAPTSPSSAKPAAKAFGGDPCAVISIADLEKLIGVTGLSVQGTRGSSNNGCHWGTADGSAGVAYDVLPMVGSTDQMISTIKSASAGKSANFSFSQVDLGNGHTGAIGIVTADGSPINNATVDLFMPPDRYAAIVLILPGSADSAAVGLSVGKAFSAVADSLPPAPKM